MAVLVTGGGFVATLLLLALFVASLRTDLVRPRPSKLVLDRRAEVLGEVAGAGDTIGWWDVPYMLPERVALATTETEDRHFYAHHGVRLRSIARALVQNVSARKTVSGASTLAMQVARMQSRRPRSLFSKLQEAAEAIILVDRFGHDEVLRQYLTLAPYGHRVHGVTRAAREYFDKPVADLSWLQAAYLAALPQAPARMSPWSDEGRARGLKRAQRILVTLHARGLLTTRDLEVALASDLGIVEHRERPPEAIHAALAWSKRAAARDGNIQYATLDLELQRITARIARANLERARARGATNTAAVVVDKETAEVLAYVGSADYFDALARGAIDFLEVKRSPGSTLKPFLYGLALDNGRTTAATLVPDTPMDFVTEAGRSYLPKNINRIFLGPMLVREALANSRNIPALRILEEVGVERALTFFYRGGVQDVSFDPGRYGLGLALGNMHTTPLELAALYRALGDGGVYQPLRFFVAGPAPAAHAQGGRSTTADGLPPGLASAARVDVGNSPAVKAAKDRGRRHARVAVSRGAPGGAPRELLDGAGVGVRILQEDSAALIIDILADASARQPSFPAGSALEYPYAVATKTGTSQGFRDGWTIAVSDRIVIVVWVGNHDWRRMNHLGGLAGTAEAAHDLMDAIMPLRAPDQSVASSFGTPRAMKRKTVCALSGKLAGPECPHHKGELFRPGTEPFAPCDMHVRVHIDKRNGLLATSTCPAAVVQERAVVRLPRAYQSWARQQRAPLLPQDESPLCGGRPRVVEGAVIALVEPRASVRYTWDPDTPPEFATIRLRADVEPRDEEVVFLVDGTPVAKVGYPHEARWTLSPGKHTVQVAFARRSEASAPVSIAVRR